MTHETSLPGGAPVSPSRPQWFRLDTNLFDNPKVHRAVAAGGHGSVLLWMQSLAYSTRHLTDGWIPLAMPKRWGYTARQAAALVDSGLWIPLEITDDGGWLIHDYRDYQPTREAWESRGEKMRAAARKRWQSNA